MKITHMAYIEINGTIPNWNKWLLPGDVYFAHNPNMIGTIPEWNNWNLTVLFQLHYVHLNYMWHIIKTIRQTHF